ncbi:MAG TPA: nucleotidyltransferase family protein [Pyrinomonadaceae bacterium]|nr:nucleotidyltransferase family protein [Pyrinomonadaceae bacterium]
MSYQLENDLLLCIGRRALSPAISQRISGLLNKPLDWSYLLQTAEHHGLAPLLHKHLSSLPETANQSYSRTIEDDAFRNTQEALYLTGQLVRLNRRFRSEEIRVLAFKGPLLSDLLYGDVSLRRAGDLDLLIERRNYKKTKIVLESMGYRMTPELTVKQEASHLASHCEIQFVRDQGFSVIDLHWELTPKSFTVRMSADDIFRNSQSIEFSGELFETFGNEDLALYLCMHAAKHLWTRFEWICAIAELLGKKDFIDMDKLVRKARQVRGERMLALGLRLVDRFYEGTVPKSAFDSLDQNGLMQKMANELATDIFRLRVTNPGSIETGLYNFRIMDQRSDAIRSLLRAIFQPTLADWESLTLPSVLHSVYYVYRPLRLMKLYASAILAKPRPDSVTTPNSQVVHSDGA